MGSIQYYNFGVKDNVWTLKIHGDKKDLYELINDCRKEGELFDTTPLINHVYKQQYSLLLKLKINQKGV